MLKKKQNWRLKESCIDFATSEEGLGIYRMHEMGYKLTNGTLGDLSILQRTFLILARNEEIRQQEEYLNNQTGGINASSTSSESSFEDLKEQVRRREGY